MIGSTSQVLSEDYGSVQHVLSFVFFLLNLLVLVSTGTSLSTHPRYIKAIAYYGFLFAATNLMYVSLSDTSQLKWFTVFTALVYAGLLTYNMTRFTTNNVSRSAEKK